MSNKLKPNLIKRAGLIALNLAIFLGITYLECQGMELDATTNPNLCNLQSLTEILPQKSRLVFGGILPGAKIGIGVDNMVIAKGFSHICSEKDLAINIQGESNCHIVGDVWTFDETLEVYPCLSQHKFQSISFNHIGDAFWGDQFSEEERIDLLSRGPEAVEQAVCETVKLLFFPILSVLDHGTFEYKSCVNDFIKDFWEETHLSFLTVDFISQKQKIQSSQEYPCLNGPLIHEETAYILTDEDHPIIKGYVRALSEMGLTNIAVQFVVSDRRAYKDSQGNRITPEVTGMLLSRKMFYEQFDFNMWPNKYIFDIFMRIKGTR